MTRGHGWLLTFTMWGTFTPYSSPAFTGAFGPPPKVPQLHLADDWPAMAPNQRPDICFTDSGSVKKKFERIRFRVYFI